MPHAFGSKSWNNMVFVVDSQPMNLSRLHMKANLSSQGKASPETPTTQRRVIFPSLHSSVFASPTGEQGDMVDRPDMHDLRASPDTREQPRTRLRHLLPLSSVLRQPEEVQISLDRSPALRAAFRPNETVGKGVSDLPETVTTKCLLPPNNKEKHIPSSLSGQQSFSPAGQRLLFPVGSYREQSLSLPTISELPVPNSFLQSILRRNHRRDDEDGTHLVTKISSVESDIPSLASTSSQSSMEDAGVTSTLAEPRRTNLRSISDPQWFRSSSTNVSFDPRVWICVFERSPAERETTWYTAQEMESFKTEAWQLIRRCSSGTVLIPTGTGRVAAMTWYLDLRF
jgi:hypothetical protein